MNTILEFRNFDLIIGASTIDFINSTLFVPTEFYIQDEITWCVSHAKLIPVWISMFYITQDLSSYILGILNLAFLIVLIFLYSTFEPRPFDLWKSMLVVGYITLFGNAHINIKRQAFKFGLGITSLLAMQMLLVFNAFFYKYMSGNAFSKPINSLNELNGQNAFHFGSQPVALKYIKMQNLVRKPLADTSQYLTISFTQIYISFQMSNFSILKNVKILKNVWNVYNLMTVQLSQHHECSLGHCPFKIRFIVLIPIKVFQPFYIHS